MRRTVMHAPASVHPGHPAVVVPVRVDPDGVAGPTPHQARGPRWRRTSPGFYVPAHVSRDLPEQRIREAAQLIPGYGGVSGWAALRWQGGRWFGGLDQGGRHVRDVVVTTMIHARAHPGVQISEERLNPREVVVVDGLPLTIPARSVLFEARYAGRLSRAMQAIDMAAYDDLVSLAECHAYLPHLSGWIGVGRAREALAMADENSWSPQETDMRREWVLDAGLPRPLCNVPVFGLDGRLVGTPDLFDPEAGVVGEYDGGHHLDGAQRGRDLRREAAFRRVGLEYVAKVAADCADPAHYLQRLHDSYRRASYLPEARRLWTLERPPWWIPTDTVEQRRALTPHQRQRLLRHRAG